MPRRDRDDAKHVRVSLTSQKQLTRSEKRRDVFGQSRMKCERYPSKNDSKDGHRLLVPTFFRMSDIEQCFHVWPF